MTRSRVPQSSPKVALFPFLAVLICTMGSLILLLVVIARQSRVQTAQVDEASVRAAEESREKLAALEEHIKMMRVLEQQGQQELAHRRAALKSIESATRKMLDELAELQSAQALLEQSMAASSTASKQAELDALKRRIAELQDRLAEARQQAQQPESYAIIPYQGPNQTRRRPIYIECRSDSIVLQPEGVVLSARDFDGPLGPGNPLAAGVRAAEQYLGRRGGLVTPGEVEFEPYPLLLVRPDGINSYYVARAALKSWGTEFGYELVEQDWQLEFQPADAALKVVEERAVQAGRERQQELAMAAAWRRPGAGGGGTAGGPASGVAGSFAERVEAGSEAAARPTFRVAPDGSIVRDRAPSDRKMSRHGSSLKRYDDIVGVQSDDGAGGGQSVGPGSGAAGGSANGLAGESLQRPSGRVGDPSSSVSPSSTPRANGIGGVTGDGQGGSLAPGRPSNASSGQNTPGGPGAPGDQPSDTAVATDQQGPLILPQQIYGRHERSDLPSLAETHGKNWALPDASRGSLPVTRPIRLECRDDAVVLLSEWPGGPPQKTIPFGAHTAASVDALVTAIWERMETWGIAGRGLYWRPELHFETTPAGQTRLNDLRALLADSGLLIHAPAQPTAARPAGAMQR